MAVPEYQRCKRLLGSHGLTCLLCGGHKGAQRGEVVQIIRGVTESEPDFPLCCHVHWVFTSSDVQGSAAMSLWSENRVQGLG